MRLRIDLAYDGGGFFGWAKQPTIRTVQGEIERVLHTITRVPVDDPAEPLRLTVAGRTDTGVHASHQVCHLDIGEETLSRCVGHMSVPPTVALKHRLQRMLPADITIHDVTVAPSGFDARFSALERTYVYRVADRASEVDPRLRGFVLHLDADLDVAAMITKDVGNRVIVVDDETHDKAAAMISHMPHVVSTALINELVANPDRNIAAALAAGCWRDMTRVSLTDPDRTRAMVEEDSLNVEVLLRRMAARLTDMADQLHAGADGEQDVMGFFAEGDPFRRYKAAVTRAGITAAQAGTATAQQAGTTAAGFPERELAVPEAGWQQTLLFSARRGEAITGFIHPRQAIVQLRPAM